MCFSINARRWKWLNPDVSRVLHAGWLYPVAKDMCSTTHLRARLEHSIDLGLLHSLGTCVLTPQCPVGSQSEWLHQAVKHTVGN